MRRTVIVATAFLIAASAVPAHAQDGGTDPGTLRGAVDQLLRFGDCPAGIPICLDVDAGTHGSHFNDDGRTIQGAMVDFLGASIARTISSLPLAATSSGSIWRPGPGGIPVETRTSAGPIFAERAATLGQGRILFGANASGFSFSSLRGQDLDDLGMTLTHENLAPESGGALGDPAFENDIIQVSADMSVSALVSSFYAAVGVTDRLDLSVAIPVVRTEVSGTAEADVIQRGPTAEHFFDQPSGQTSAQSSVDESATGIGDVALRGKYQFTDPAATLSLGVLADARLATGDEEDFHGAGSSSFRGLLIASGTYGVFGPHLNAGYMIRGAETANDVFLATLGFDVLAADRVTLAADLIGEFETEDSPLTFPGGREFTDGSTVDPIPFPTERDDIVDLAVGAKASPTQGLNVIGNVLFPINKDRGLRPDLGWTVGVEYNFGT